MLCTPSKTFHLRQVQTSSPLFVTQPALEAHGNAIPAPTTRAVASCTATLELQPSDDSPVPALEQVLPLFDIVDGDVDARGTGKSQAAILPHLPFSDGQCIQAWQELMAFEFAGSSFRPSARALLQVWKSMLAAAVAEGVKLDGQFLTEDLSGAVADEGYPAALAVAMLKRLSSDDQDTDGLWSCLDRAKTVSFVAKTLLEAKQDGPNYPTADFINTWKDSLPELWREDAELKTISGTYDLPTSTTIRLKGSAAANTKAHTSSSKPAASRKWHEKFSRARKR